MMRKALILLSATVIAVVPLRNSNAGDREWATAGKVMAGLATLAIIGDLVADQSPVYVTAPPPRRVIRVYTPTRVWVEGRHVEIVRKRWVTGHFERTWAPPARQRIWVATPRGGYWQDTIVRPAFGRRVWRPGYYVRRRETQWVPGHWRQI